MSYTAEEAMEALIGGVKEGRRTSLAEAPYVSETLGFDPDINTLRNLPIEIGYLPPPALGVTKISPEGKAVSMRISPYIASIGHYLGQKYSRSRDWVLGFIRQYAKDVTGHEDYHVMSAPMLRGEELTEENRILAESVTTRGRYKVKKRLGKHKEADFVEATNPDSLTYRLAWRMSELADSMYEGPSGRGHRGLLADAHKEPLYKPIGRFARQAIGAGFRKIGNYLRGAGTPSYAPAAA